MLLSVVELKHVDKKSILGESFLLSRSWQSRTSFVFISNHLLSLEDVAVDFGMRFKPVLGGRGTWYVLD